jgi:hypothetical protein
MMVLGRTLRRPRNITASNLRLFVTKDQNADSPPPSSSAVEWRKKQLDLLERKFTDPQTIENEDDLQPTWKAMESRVTKRRPLTTDQRAGKTGRMNIRRTEEDIWLEVGLYDDDSNKDKGGK